MDRHVPHVAALDGIRALAVGAVVAYHLRLSWAPGGFAGVPVFFVLSGYLITAILAGRWSTSRSLHVRTFWRRRARRLLPAQVVLVGGVVLASPWLDPGPLRRLPAAATTALLQVGNWWQVVAGEPYFEAAKGPAVFSHLWSLAVEAQLYLLWPLGLAVLLRRRAPARWVAALAWASYVLMAVVHQPYTDPTRAWVGTDTQAGPFLLGAMAALLVPPARPREAPGRHAGVLLDVVATAAVGVVAWFVLAVDDFEPFAYRGGLAAVGVASAALVVVAVHPTSLVGRLLSAAPLRWVGERSYGLYLWHWPVIALTRQWEATWSPAALLAFRVGVSVVAAALSYRLVERRFHRTRPSTAPVVLRPRPALLPRLVAVTATACVVVGVATAWDERSAPVEAQLASSRVVRAIPLPTTTTSTSTTTTAPAAPAAPATTTTTTLPAPTGIDVAIGDSVLHDAVADLHRVVPGITVDAAVGRQLWHARATVDKVRAQAGLHRVVLSLGTNGAFPPGDLDELLASLQDARRVVLVNVRMPRSWESEVNMALAGAVARYPNTVLVDWHAYSRDRTDLFARDGTHVNRRGAEAYALLIAAGLDA